MSKLKTLTVLPTCLLLSFTSWGEEALWKKINLEVAELLARHVLFSRAVQQLERAPDSLWGRRRLFYMDEKPLLVNEIFLPELPELK